jgi:ABC-type transport system involved in cytochrome c biogenesis ATPase subunit
MSASLSGRRKTVALTRFMLAIFFLWLLADEWFSMIVSHVSTELEIDLKQAKLRTRPETTEFGLRQHARSACRVG